ncbi:serine/threonine-protein kinase-like protein CCR1 [Mercurialis annua]|uniref:serine/threonine-protein kinase-like protein CCR1 n=1 Tax=Mercurialis annua TaxID=3986 RepID=UPI00215E0532|nr:serine/threonine-protein kinase-like protein CCR1 [Mercurialis annua]
MACIDYTKCPKPSTSPLNTGIIVGACVLAVLFLVVYYLCYRSRIVVRSKEQLKACTGTLELEENSSSDEQPPTYSPPRFFRTSELKDAAMGLNRIGRGSYGFVCRMCLPDGRIVAVKRASAATIFNTGRVAFETNLRVLSQARDRNIVNLLGYCLEFGQRLLVYEYMSHGSLYNHLHIERSHLDWELRMRMALQAAKGLDYLHRKCEIPIVHGNVKSSNILLDADWRAKVADFGLINSSDKKSDVFNFGIILLEIISRRKAFDTDYTPPSINEWAIPLIRKGDGVAVIDQDGILLPKNLQPILQFIHVANLALTDDPNNRPEMSEVVSLLAQIVKDQVQSIVSM